MDSHNDTVYEDGYGDGSYGSTDPYFEDGDVTHAPVSVSASSEVRAQTRQAWFAIAAAALQSGCDAQRAATLIAQLKGASVLYRALDSEASRLRRTLTHVSAVLGDVHSGEIWMEPLGLLVPTRVADDIRQVLAEIAVTVPEPHPEARLAGAISAARKQLSLNEALNLVRAVESGADPETLAEAHTAVVEAPPTAFDDSGISSENASVAEMFSEAVDFGGITMSSGFASLDRALWTRPEFPAGLGRSGQLVVVVAPSGSGKSSWLNTALPAIVVDVVRQGHGGRVLFHHNEDETTDILASMGFAPGGRYAKYADRLVALKSTSREEFVKFVYREVLRAKRLSTETGLPVSHFMPAAVVSDYYQSLSSPSDKGNETVSTATSADLLLYGVANCDPVAMKTFSGISFGEYAGESWPDGLAGWGTLVVVTAQLLLKGNAKPFNPDKDNWRDYATADALDQPVWQPQAGDYPLAKLDDIRGATKIIQHATTIIGLHRPRPRNNPEIGLNAAGFPTLADTRGFFTILKARFGQKLLVVPMEFNRQRNGGTKAQYIDAAAEAAVAAGRTMKVDEEAFRTSGDPIVPLRPKRSRMKSVRY
jgi:hypothetical protein